MVWKTKKNVVPDQCGSDGWMLFHIAKGRWFDSQAGEKEFSEVFYAMGSWEAPGFSSPVATETFYYSGRDQVDQETPLVSGASSALGIHAPSQSICVILFITDISYLSPPPGAKRLKSKRFYEKNIQWRLLKISSQVK